MTDHDLDIALLHITTRSYICLTKSGIRTIGDLYQHTEADLMRITNFGAGTLHDVRSALEDAGLPSLRIGIERPQPEPTRPSLLKRALAWFKR